MLKLQSTIDSIQFDTIHSNLEAVRLFQYFNKSESVCVYTMTRENHKDLLEENETLKMLWETCELRNILASSRMCLDFEKRKFERI